MNSHRLPKILVTNDDGVYAPGLKHLWNAVKDLGEVYVVAPAGEQSAVGLSITLRHPLRIEKVEWAQSPAKVWSVNGTPADCVKLALNVIMPDYPDLIVSGINRGTNCGRNVLYSGTVAAIIEGVLHDLPGIAFSIGDYIDPSFGEVEEYVAQIVSYVFNHPLPVGTCLNVNFPRKTLGPIKGIRLARQGKEYWAEKPEQRSHPAELQPYYWLGSQVAQFKEEADSDVTLLKQGFVTVVPIHIGSLTDDVYLSNQKLLFQSLFNPSLNCK